MTSGTSGNAGEGIRLMVDLCHNGVMVSKIKERKIEKYKTFFLDILFPRNCVNCEKEGSFVCENCSLFLSEAELVCPSCERPSYFGQKHKECGSVYQKRAKLSMEGLVGLWDYEGVVRKGIHDAKYNKLVPRILEELMDAFFLRTESNKERLAPFFSFLFQEDTVITFVPTHAENKKRRGFCHGEAIAKHLAKITNKKVVQMFFKNKKVSSQTRLNREERKENVKNVFSLLKEVTVSKRMVIVDDVWTSGATMRECSKTLKENGVEEVWGFTLSKTP